MTAPPPDGKVGASLRRIVETFVARPWTTALTWLAITVLFVLGATRLTIDVSSASFYGDGDERFAVWEDFRDRWGPDDRTVAIIASTADGSPVATPTRLASVSELCSTLALRPGVERCRSLGDLRPDPAGATILDLVASAPADVATRLPDLLHNNERVVPLWLSNAGDRTAVFVELVGTSDDLARVSTVLRDLQRTADAYASRGDLEFAFAGVPSVRAAFFGLTLRDQMVLVPLTMLVVGVGLWSSFRSVATVTLLGVASGLPLLYLLGLMGWMGEPIGLLNQSYFTLLPIVALANALHFLARVHEEATRHPWTRAISVAAARVGTACALTSLTTAAGFASLAWATMPILRRFGAFASFGIVAAFATLLLAMPLGLALLGPPQRLPKRTARSTVALGRWAAQRPRLALAGFAALTILGVWRVPSTLVDNRLGDLLLPSHPTAVANRELDETLGGSLSLEVELRAAPGHWDTASGRATLEELEDWAMRQPMVRAVVSPIQVEAFRRPELGRVRISLRVADVGGRAFVGFADQVEEELHDILTGQAAIAVVTGTTLIAYEGVNRISDDLRWSLGSVLLVITLVIAWTFRRVRAALISIPPNALPVLLGYAALSLRSVPVDPIGLVILTIALGIAVDDTIHLMMRFREGLRSGHRGTAAIDGALHHSGHIVTVTSATLCIGLSVNLLSSFPPLQLLGGLGALVVGLAWACDVMMLPALLARFPRAVVRPPDPPG